MIADKTARLLKPVANDHDDYTAILAYVEDRSKSLHDQLANARTWDEVKELQGRLREVQRLTTLRAEVNAI